MQPAPARYLIFAVVADGGVSGEVRRAVQAAMSMAALPDWSSFEADDGLVLLVPEPPHAYVGTGQFVEALASRLFTQGRWRVRVGAHLAGIDRASPVVESHAIRVTLLLADAQPVRRALEDAGGTLAVALSGEVIGAHKGGLGRPWRDPFKLRDPFELPDEPTVGWVAVLAPPSAIANPLEAQGSQGSSGGSQGGRYGVPADPDHRPTWLTEEDEISWEGPADYAPPPGPDFPTDR